MINGIQFFKYCIHIEGKYPFRNIHKVLQNNQPIQFKPPLTQNKRPKIYVIKHNNEVVYVGYASQSIGTRLGQGLRAKGERGYYGYKWKEYNEVGLFVFVFDPFKEIKVMMFTIITSVL